MTRRVSVEFSETVLAHLKGEEPVTIHAQEADTNQLWEIHLQRDADRQVIMLHMRLQPAWDIRIEGIVVGQAQGTDPVEAARRTLQTAGITSLPEAVAVQVVDPEGQSIMVFTLGNQAFQMPQKRFNEEVVGTTRWISARQKKKREIDALRQELQKIVAEQRG
jgi:hypothetical protein